MITFECPSCRSKAQAAEDFAGKSVLCPQCQHEVKVPAPSGITTPDLARATPRTPPRDGKGSGAYAEGPPPWVGKPGSGAPSTILRLVIFSVVITGILAIVVALFVPATRRVRESAARTQSTNNLKQIVLAMHGFYDVNKRLPFNGSDDSKDPGGHYTAAAAPSTATSGSWAFQILPYIDQASMYKNLERNSGVAGYMDPMRGRASFETGGGAWTDYFLNNYLNDPVHASKPNNPDHKVTMTAITDGVSNTVFVGSGNINVDQYASTKDVTLSTDIFLGGTTGTIRAGDDGKVNPAGVRLQKDSKTAPGIGSWGGPFSQGALMGMGDGTVRLFPYSTANFGTFLTPTGGEEVVLPDT